MALHRSYFLAAAHAVAALLACSVTAAASPLHIGAEATDRPPMFVNTLPITYSPWYTSGGNLSAVDEHGWPTGDAYAVLWDYAPWEHDPNPTLPNVFGNYSLEFAGKADIVVGPNIPVQVSNISFDAATWTTRAVVEFTYPQGSAAPGIALGFFNSYRNSSSPLGTGVTNVRLLQPGYSVWSPSVPVFTSAALAAMSPLSQLRLMEHLCTNCEVSSDQQLEWAGRRQWTDALWGQPNVPRFTALPGWPWEAVVLLAQALPGKPLWINVHVAASGADPSDTNSYIYNLALLLRDGNEYTGNKGVPPGTVLYVEHGNEAWLNGTVGGPDITYTWNLAAAIREVEAGGSPLNSDGATDPTVWAHRRHLKRIREIHAIFTAVFAGGGSGGSSSPSSSTTFPSSSSPSAAAAPAPAPAPIELRMVFGWYQDYTSEAQDALTWYKATYNEEPSAVIYGMAINSYYIVSVPLLASPGDIASSLLLASDAAAPARQASMEIVTSWGLSALLSYEGMPFATPALGNDDNVTWGVIIDTMRSPLIQPVMEYDVLQGWARLGPAAREYNFYALSSPYGPYPICTWGLSEDITNTTTPKWAAVRDLLAAPWPGVGQEVSDGRLAAMQALRDAARAHAQASPHMPTLSTLRSRREVELYLQAGRGEGQGGRGQGAARRSFTFVEGALV